MKNRIIICGMVGLATSAFAADVSGTTVVLGKGLVRDAVVWLEGNARPTAPAHAVMDQRNKKFIPHVMAVPVGTTVEFPNNDPMFHNVFAYFEAKKFDLGMYARGASKRQTFNKPGLVAMLCNVHSEMSAYIMVVNTPYYAVSDKNGRFTIAGVQPGTYTVRGWHESGCTFTQKLLVKGDTPLNVSLKR